MDHQECLLRQNELARFLESQAPVSIKGLSFLGDGLYAVADKVTIPCIPTAQFEIDCSSPILDIPIVLEDEQIGSLCLSSQLRSSSTTLAAITDVQKHAVVRLASSDDFDRGDEGLLSQSYDCVVIDRAHVEQFLEHRSTSSFWGGFVLKPDEIPLEKSATTASSATIRILDLAPPRTARHRAALQRATQSSIAVDRFLHLYHFLELDYDHEIVRRIIGIDAENTKDLERLLGTGRTELDRLHLVCDGFSAINELEEIACSLGKHRESALTVFYDYGKDQNPLKEQIAFEKQFLEAPTVNRETLDTIKKSFNLKLNFAHDTDTYNAVLVKLACYWTYRIRCCIAHNKLGEYHLRTASDMRFVAEFGEPLVKALIAHRLRREGAKPRNCGLSKEFKRRLAIAENSRRRSKALGQA